MKIHYRDYTAPENRDEKHMVAALEVAAACKMRGDAPIGATLALPLHALSEGNSVKSEGHILNHAEINVVNKAREMGFRNLKSGTLYSTVEPTPLAVLLALEHGIKEIVFGAYDLKNGFVSSKALNLNIVPITYRGGVMAKECRDILPIYMKEYTREENDPS